MEYICNRLTVVGAAPMLRHFARSRWQKILGAKHSQVSEHSRGRYVTEFNTEIAPIIEPLRNLSLRWRKLIFLLDWEWERKRLKGFVNAKAGRLESYQLEY